MSPGTAQVPFLVGPLGEPLGDGPDGPLGRPSSSGVAEPMWFGPSDRPLFGWLHRPASDGARCGVVLCPPVGDEERRVYSTFRKLADNLTEAGHVVLRFSYDGTGDSAGAFDDPDRVEAWTRSIAEAVAVVRRSGATRIAAVGMRLGATLATRAAATLDPALDALVLWDPCADGREFLRHQQILLASLSETPRPEWVGVSTPGYDFPPAMVDDLDGLQLVPVTSSRTRTLLLVRPDRPGRNRLVRRMGETRFDQLDAVGQAELLDVPPLSAVIPYATLSAIAAWLSAPTGSDGPTGPAEPAAFVAPAAPLAPLAPAAPAAPAAPLGPAESTGSTPQPLPETAVVGHDRNGRPIYERAVRLGPIGLFAVTTVPEDGGSGPWMMFVNVATEHHIGPGRLWVDLARHWAGFGLRSVRFDLSGCGDSPVHPGQRENVPYSRHWLDDLPALARAVSPDDPTDAVYIGLCSGGYGAFEAALSVGARGVYVINPVLSAPDANLEPDPRRRALRTLPPALARLARQHGRTAWWTWRTYRQFAPWQAPMAVCASAVRAGVDVFVISGVADARPFREVRFWRWIGEPRLRRTGRFELVTVPGMDHVLLFGQGRDEAARLLRQRVLERFNGRR